MADYTYGVESRFPYRLNDWRKSLLLPTSREQFPKLVAFASRCTGKLLNYFEFEAANHYAGYKRKRPR